MKVFTFEKFLLRKFGYERFDMVTCADHDSVENFFGLFSGLVILDFDLPPPSFLVIIVRLHRDDVVIVGDVFLQIEVLRISHEII